MTSPEFFIDGFQKSDDEVKKEIRSCLQDYSNDFIGLKILLGGERGIEAVNDFFRRGERVSTVEEYLDKYRIEKGKTLDASDQENQFFIENAGKLNKLAKDINKSGEKIKEKKFLKIIKEVENIIRSK